jgi:hypothetical protein
MGMRPPRITIGALMRLVVACGCGMAVLRYASPLWSDVTFGGTLLVLLTAVVAAVKGRHRTAWLGFAVFGWGAAIVLWGFAMHEAVSNEQATVRSMPSMTIPYTPLTGLLETLYPIVHYAPPNGAIKGVVVRAIPSGVVHASFQWIGHAMACLLFGCVGAITAIITEARCRMREHQADIRAPM